MGVFIVSDIVSYLEKHSGLFVALGGIATFLGVVVGWIIAVARRKKEATLHPGSPEPAHLLPGRKRFWLALVGSSAVVLSVLLMLMLLWPEGGNEPRRPPAGPAPGVPA